MDHDGQLARLRAAIGPDRIQVADCLDSCDYSNVVVVRPAKTAREAGARPVRLGGILTDDAVENVVEWVLAGGPGRAAMPDALTGSVLDRTAEDAASA